MQFTPSSQSVGSEVPVTLPRPLTTISTSLLESPSVIVRVFLTASASLMSPWMIVRFGYLANGNWEVSFGGVRARTLTRSPAWSEWRRTARPQPPVAPKMASVEAEGVDDDMLNCGKCFLVCSWGAGSLKLKMLRLRLI